MVSTDSLPQSPSPEGIEPYWSLIPELQAIHLHFSPLFRLAAFGEERLDDDEPCGKEKGEGHSAAIAAWEAVTHRGWKKRRIGRQELVHCEAPTGVRREMCNNGNEESTKEGISIPASSGSSTGGSENKGHLLVTSSVGALLRPPPTIECCHKKATIFRGVDAEKLNVTKSTNDSAEQQGTALQQNIQSLQRWWECKRSANDSYAELVEEEVRNRKSMDDEWEETHRHHSLVWRSIQRLYISPETKKAMASLEQEESRQRVIDLTQPYQNFCHWVYQMIPDWENAVREKIASNAAKDAAMEAARKVLEAELLKKHSSSSPLPSDASCSTTGWLEGNKSEGSELEHWIEKKGMALTKDDLQSHSFVPPLSVTPKSIATPTPVGASGCSGDELAHQNLRRQAIQMLSMQEEAIKTRRMQQLHSLKGEENRLRENLERRELEKKKNARLEQYQLLAEEEAAARYRLDEAKRLQEIRREERRILLEHLKAEEEILRVRIHGYEEARKAAEAAAREQEAREKQKRNDRLRIEEEILLKRMKEHEHQRQMEAMSLAKAREEREAKERALKNWRMFEEEERERAAARNRERLYQEQREEMLERERRRRFFSDF